MLLVVLSGWEYGGDDTKKGGGGGGGCDMITVGEFSMIKEETMVKLDGIFY